MTKPGCVLPKQWQPYVEQLETKVRELEAEVDTFRKGFTPFGEVVSAETLVAEHEPRQLAVFLMAEYLDRVRAEATLARVEALPGKWRKGVAFRNCESMVNHPSWDECADELQAALQDKDHD